MYVDKYDYLLNNLNNYEIEEEINQTQDKLWEIEENKLNIINNFEEILKEENKNSSENLDLVNLKDPNIKQLRLQNIKMQICSLQIKQFVESIMNIKKSTINDNYFLIFDPCEKMDSILIDEMKYRSFIRYRDTLNSISVYDLFQEKIHSY